MLVIRMQRTGRKGHAMFRVVVQDSRVTPTSGKVIANIGHVDPHAKTVTIDKEKATHFLTNGAQPSERVARLFKSEGIALPSWVKLSADKARAVRNPDKRRSTSPAAPAEEVVAEAEAEAVEAEIEAVQAVEEAVAEEVAEDIVAEAAAEEVVAEAEAENETEKVAEA